MLNNIHNNVEKAQAYVKQANQDLKLVTASVNNKRNCQCFILCGLAVIGGIIAIPIALQFA